MISEKLEKLGLTKNEARIYVSLLEIGDAQVGKLSKKAQINRPATYDATERLIEKGVISYAISANRKIFRATDPKIFLNQIKEKEEAANEILPELSGLYNSTKQVEESQTYVGKKGIKSILNDILLYKEYIAYGSSGKFMEIMKHDFIAFQNRKKELDIKSKVIPTESTKQKDDLRKVAYAEIKYLPDSYSIPITMIIYGKKVAILSWGETPMATLITSKSVSNSFKTYFELLWNIAKK
jgi:sugar-specific transcriptional regulator TrmB